MNQNISFKRIQAFSLAGFTIVLILIQSSCDFSKSPLKPGDPDVLEPLVEYHGTTLNLGDTTLSAKRFQGLVNPKITLVWQFMGLKPFLATYFDNSVKIEPPFDFSGSIDLPPPRSVYNSSEAAIGSFWLFSDRNDNGRFDRLNHPDLLRELKILDSLENNFHLALDSLNGISTYINPRVPHQDTFRIETFGTTVRKNGEKWDTLWSSSIKEDAQFWEAIILRRSQILTDRSRWEEFFRRRMPREEILEYLPQEASAHMVTYSFNRKLFPLKGKEIEFEKNLQRATVAYYKIYRKSLEITQKRRSLGWADYPFESFFTPGQDWAAGRSIQHFALYFPNEESLKEILDAERHSNFLVHEWDNLKPGFNLLYCDADRNCRVLPWDAPIHIFLGEKEDFFSPPPRPDNTLVEPEKIPDSISDTVQYDFNQFKGIYEYRPFSPVFLEIIDDQIWLDVPDLGLLRMKPVDSVTFINPFFNLQVKVFKPSQNEIMTQKLPTKLILYHNGNRYSATKTGNVIPDSIKSQMEINAIPSTSNSSISFSLDSLYFGTKDTLRIIENSSDTIRAKVGKLNVSEFIYTNTGNFKNPWSDYELVPWIGNQNHISGFSFQNGSETFFYGDAGKNQGLSELPISERNWQVLYQNNGSKPDLFRDLMGRPLYSCSEDNKFLPVQQIPSFGINEIKSDKGISLLRTMDEIKINITANKNDSVQLVLTACLGTFYSASWIFTEFETNQLDKTKSQKVFRLPVAPEGIKWVFPPILMVTDTLELSIQKANSELENVPIAIDSYNVLINTGL